MTDRTLVETMRTNILLSFAMNNGKTMSPAESMSLVRLPPDPRFARIWGEAVEELVASGILKLAHIRQGGWTVPMLRVADFAALPYREATMLMSRRDFALREQLRWPRVCIPAARARYGADAP